MAEGMQISNGTRLLQQQCAETVLEKFARDLLFIAREPNHLIYVPAVLIGAAG